MDSPRELAQLGDRLLDLVLCAREQRRLSPASARDASRPSATRQRHEPLLRAVVEVALDPAALGVGRGDDPAAGRAHLRELRAHLGRQALVLEHERGGGANGFDERRLVEQRRIVNRARRPLRRPPSPA